MNKVILFAVWIVLCMITITEVGYLLSYPSTIANIVGFLGLVLFTLLSCWTECLTKVNQITNKKQ